MDRLARRLRGACDCLGDPLLGLHRRGAARRADGRGWGTLFTRTFLSLSDYWQGGLGVPAVADGAARSYLAALLSVISHSLATIVRLASGLVLGGVLGFALGLAVSWSPWSRRLVQLPTQFLRALPLLAMVPLFQLWFGTYFFGQVLFVAYGVGVIVFAGVVNAVRNVPQIFIDNARALGASRLQLYRTVVLPAILPAMRSVVLLEPRRGLGRGSRRGISRRSVRARLHHRLRAAVRTARPDVLDRDSVHSLHVGKLLGDPAAVRAPARLGAVLAERDRWTDPILDQSACSLVDRMRRGELTAVETMRAFLDRIAALEPELRAFAYLDPDAALAAAERVDQTRAAGIAPGPLHGLPVAVKDIIDTADMPTEFGAEIFAGRTAGAGRGHRA